MNIDAIKRDIERQKLSDPEDLMAREKYLYLLYRLETPEFIWQYNGTRLLSSSGIQRNRLLRNRHSHWSESYTEKFLTSTTRVVRCSNRSLSRMTLSRDSQLSLDIQGISIQARAMSSGSVLDTKRFCHTHRVPITDSPRRIDMKLWKQEF